ncbi:MAG: hypothetical protein LUH15_08090 [Tannerellaceae bacterium]|nr:hypothetical protein [Tannerellaceae bacterium]
MKIKSFAVGQMCQQQAAVKVYDLKGITFLKPFVETFSSAVRRFDLALKLIRKNLLTEQISRADERRHNAWRGLKIAV